MTDPQLQAALRAGADGLYALEAGTGMILAHGTWPAREDFRCFVHVADSITDPGTELASIDWEAAITALNAGEFPSSSGKSECSDSLPASPETSLSSSATPSPVTTTATSISWSPRSSTPPDDASFLASG